MLTENRGLTHALQKKMDRRMQDVQTTRKNNIFLKKTCTRMGQIRGAPPHLANRPPCLPLHLGQPKAGGHLGAHQLAEQPTGAGSAEGDGGQEITPPSSTDLWLTQEGLEV